VVGLLIVVSFVVSYIVSAPEGRAAWRVDAGETLFLTAYFLVVPPILAVGVFFCCWHSVRHIVRLLLLNDGTATQLELGDITGATGRFVRQATPLSVGALGLFSALALAVPVAPVEWIDLFGVYLVGIAVLTAPHIIIVTWLDLDTKLWESTRVDHES